MNINCSPSPQAESSPAHRETGGLGYVGGMPSARRGHSRFNALLLLLACLVVSGCGAEGSLSPVDHIIDGERSFQISCAGKASCDEGAKEICARQGFDSYAVLERSEGDEIGEGRSIVVYCQPAKNG